mmetsp:Transcript_38156/g.88810  ORF Transcript_38156/g.88810 Transcript_38156/m.88810 type:complete len:310 (+) Transcript_38156:142-1071(+)
MWEYLHKMSYSCVKIIQHFLSHRASCMIHMFLNEPPQQLLVFQIINIIQPHQSHITPFREFSIRVIDVGNAPTHASSKVTTRFTKTDEISPRHILRAMISNPLHHGGGPRVTHTKAFPSNASEECFASGSPKEGNIAYNHVVLWNKAIMDNLLGRIDRDLASAETLASAIIGISLHFHEDTLGQGKCKTLTRMSLQFDVYSLVWQSITAMQGGDLVGKHGATGTVEVGNVALNGNRSFVFQGILSTFNEHVVLGHVDTMILGGSIFYACTWVEILCWREQRRQVKSTTLIICAMTVHFKMLALPNHFIH